MYDKREAVKAEIIEARSDWDRAKLEKRPASEIATLRQKVVALVGELQTLNGRGPASVETPSTAVRLHALGRLCARWRAESEKIWKAANGYPEEKDRIRADTLDSAADELEMEIGAAGAGPTDEALRPAERGLGANE